MRCLPLSRRAQAPGLWGRILALVRCASLKQQSWLESRRVTPPSGHAAKTTWLWGLHGKQGMQASLCCVDSKHLDRCRRSPSSGGLSTLSMPTSSVSHSLPKSHWGDPSCCPPRPEQKSKQRRTPNTTFTYARGRLPPTLPIEFLMTVVSPSAEQLPRIEPRPGREHHHTAYSVLQITPQQILSDNLIRGIYTPVCCDL